MNPLSKKMSFVCIFLAFIHVSVAQVGIGTSQPNSKAQLDVTSTSKGFLPPRMSYSQRQNIAAPIPAGLMIWCSDCGNNGEMQFYNGTSWVTFTATSTTAPISITTNTPTSITNTTANASATSTGITTPSELGFLYTSANTSTIADADLIATNFSVSRQTISPIPNPFSGSFSSSISNLSTNTSYRIRAYVGVFSNMTTNYSYGNILTFTTTNAQVTAPQVSTSAASSVTQTSASLEGNITSDGGGNITSRGFHYQTGSSTFTDGATPSYQTIQGFGTNNNISAFLSSLSASTMYYFRAYATNSAGTGLGSVLTFTTPAPSAPTVILSPPPSSTSAGTISANGNISSTGGVVVTGVGFEYTISTNPFSQSNSGTSVQASLPVSPATSFNAQITGLAPGTYLVRAFATNSQGTSRSMEQSVTVQ